MKLPGRSITVERVETIAELLTGPLAPAIVAVDIPIGLPDAGARECDLIVRRLLGPGRGSSVFPAPIRDVLDAVDYNDACARRLAVDGKKISIQTFAIVPKIRDVDETVRALDTDQRKLREVHPELCFAFLAGGSPARHNKRTREGQAERIRLLEPHFDAALTEAITLNRPTGVAIDDILDAFAALWSAERIYQGRSVTHPSIPPVDRYGLRMEIVV